MNCNIISDLIPLYIDGCCSEESKIMVEEHIASCQACRELLNTMKVPTETVAVTNVPRKFSKLNDWKASVLQSLLLFLPFGLITVGVWLEANTPSGLLNGFWAYSLVIPATGFMLSLANWYFVRVYNSRKSFSRSCLIVNLAITVCGYIWAFFHYGLELQDFGKHFVTHGFVEGMGLLLRVGTLFFGVGISLTILFCVLSKTLSNWYAKMLGKE